MFLYFWLVLLAVFHKAEMSSDTCAFTQQMFSLVSPKSCSAEEFFWVHSLQFLLTFLQPYHLFFFLLYTHCSYNPAALIMTSFLVRKHVPIEACCLLVASHQLFVALFYLLTSMQYKVKFFLLPGIKCGKGTVLF